MADYEGKATVIEGTRRPVKKTTQGEIVEIYVRPWIPVILLVVTLLGLANLLYTNHVTANDPPAVKIEREKTAQLVFETQKKMYEAKIAEAKGEQSAYRSPVSDSNNKGKACTVTTAMRSQPWNWDMSCGRTTVESFPEGMGRHMYGIISPKSNVRSIEGRYKISVLTGPGKDFYFCQTENPEGENFSRDNCREEIAKIPVTKENGGILRIWFNSFPDPIHVVHH